MRIIAAGGALSRRFGAQKTTHRSASLTCKTGPLVHPAEKTRRELALPIVRQPPLQPHPPSGLSHTLRDVSFCTHGPRCMEGSLKAWPMLVARFSPKLASLESPWRTFFTMINAIRGSEGNPWMPQPHLWLQSATQSTTRVNQLP